MPLCCFCCQKCIYCQYNEEQLLRLNFVEDIQKANMRRMKNVTAKLPIRSPFEALTQMIIAVASAHDLYKIQTTIYYY